MKKWLAKIFGKANPTQSTPAGLVFPIPWEINRQSIYQYLLPYAKENEPLPEKAQILPDENRLKGELRWVAGGIDGAFGHHGGGSTAEETAEQLLDMLIAVLEHPSKSNMQKLYALLTDESPLDYIDLLMEKLLQSPSLSPPKLCDLMHWLAVESPDRNPVKCAIALLAYFPSDENKTLVATLGLHEEFTLFTVVALRNMLPAECLEEALFKLAKRVTGWGRIQLIERLPDDVSAATKDWLLREGYSNSVMLEYTAWDCATKGQLLTALTNDNVDSGLLIGAGDILSVLINGGPARDIDDYADGAQACHRFLALVRQTADDNINHLLNAGIIGDFVNDKDKNWESLLAKGWSKELRQKMSDDAGVILDQPKWREKVEKDLTLSENPHYLTIQAAKRLEIDYWGAIFASQSLCPEVSNWYELMQTESVERLEQILALAESQLDLPAIATGPDTQMGLGPQYQQHSALGFILQDLKRFPGKGWKLIKTGLCSPVIRNRHMALNALENWPLEKHPVELHELLVAAYQHEPEEGIRERLEKALSECKV
ncbi:hypothetical protein [Pantoea coffeiphila]|uniref:hypothetical protein n=1 Tax=Pantoea coffeiphila TaxID=1465635 RepID=UPI00196121B1|nr:hypothetical protein [Pantoea coffeiphila]MBM7344437.1 hypothetical protein [Pantoea coffeiphila]